MNFFFDLPSINDSTELSKLVKSEKISHKEYEFLIQCQESREKFINLTKYENCMQMIKTGDSMINYQTVMDSYLKTNVDLMYLLVKHNSFPPNFRYNTFLTLQEKTYTTSSDSIEEACACEIVMVRYLYAFLYSLDAGKNIQYIREKYAGTLAENTLSEGFIKELNQALLKFKIGREPLRKLYNVMPEILKSLVTKKGEILSEFKGEIIKAVKLILEVNANSLYIENLRILKEYDNLSKVCKASFDKVYTVLQIIFNEGKNFKKELKEFCDCCLVYFKAYFCWAQIKINEQYLKIEDYTKKSFTILTKEILNLSTDIMNNYKLYCSFKINSDYYDFGNKVLSEVFYPVANYYYKIYGGIHHNVDKTIIKTADEMFKCVEILDYFENINS